MKEKLTDDSTLVNEKNENAEFDDFVDENGINRIRVEVPAHKNPGVVIPIDIITRVLKVMLDKSNYPLLVHCNKGKVSQPFIPICDLYEKFN